ncbi:MAG: TIGR00268 family protein, partial [Desulfobacteraceae bacterium]
MDPHIAFEKKEKLKNRLRPYDSVLIAFSGGVDSTFLLAVAHEIFGEYVLAVTATSAIHPQSETEWAQNFTRERGIRHWVLASREMDLPEF